MTSPTSLRQTERREILREALPATAGLLRRRRACEIAESDIDDYVALNWMEWNGGGLRLTTTGENICRQVTTSLAREPSAGS